MDFFTRQIHQWYCHFKRDLPWRNTTDPYYIWLSEIILQQTRINQGWAYYTRFTEAFPCVKDLANASEDQVLKLWQGLGYYSRARNLHHTAKLIVDQYGGKFPKTYKGLLSLKGIGEYTAAAIASISFHEQVPAVDGNVYRVLSRYFGISEPMDTTPGKKIFMQLAKELVIGTNPGMHNQAMMEFGALQCTPLKPNCPECPLINSCFAYLNNKQGELPVKSKKAKQKNRYFNYFVLINNESTWLRKRTHNDIWKNLYEFPMTETLTDTDLQTLFSLDEVKNLLSDDFVIEKTGNWKVHLLTHQKIYYRILVIRLLKNNPLPGEFIQVNKADIINFAIPKLLEKAVMEHI
ncbi:MAG: A/G-specific adenine glycosylase [Candidatus Saccharibacteria bacterium]